MPMIDCEHCGRKLFAGSMAESHIAGCRPLSTAESLQGLVRLLYSKPGQLSSFKDDMPPADRLKAWLEQGKAEQSDLDQALCWYAAMLLLLDRRHF